MVRKLHVHTTLEVDGAAAAAAAAAAATTGAGALGLPSSHPHAWRCKEHLPVLAPTPPTEPRLCASQLAPQVQQAQLA